MRSLSELIYVAPSRGVQNVDRYLPVLNRYLLGCCCLGKAARLSATALGDGP